PPSRPTATQVGTKTFAARQDGPVARSVRPAPISASVPEVSTRRIESTAPGSPSASVETAREPKVTIAKPGDTTVATRPLEADPRGESTRPRRGLAVPGVAGAAALAICAFFLGRAATSAPRPAAEPAAITAPTSAPAPAPTPAPAPAPTPAPEALAPPASAAPPTGARAQLTLVGDGTFVTVDGVARGACPAHVSLEAG